MISKINFVKMHGLGNDCVIVNKQDLLNSHNLSQLAKNIADRHTGIGCDQFIIYENHNNFYEMIIYNIDGSSAKLCGNATRCLAKLIYLDTGKKDITIVVGNKELLCRIEDENKISVNVGAVSFNETWMPSRDKIWAFAARYMIDLKETICVDVGNPHLVIFSKLESQDQKIVGETLQAKELFANGVNVNFAEIKDNKINLSVWERGVGLTGACGSGACGSFAAGLKRGFIHSPSTVVFKHGSLNMKEENGNIIMQGSATLIAEGVYCCE
ncbi:diaminopimelate epimerase [Rickettsia canadensis]|uniref:Diaminopimelate epimerase n=1 Tax=Rickettsia canadensis str. CA410 TaxID=1105107 RepID=A0ABM5MRN9_RICCA|nr:diaminopimelate epimerase [Rickettsia canadensis]AFB21162.1 diaminopimelate epimerase [Rickettsia canadensis str. CA410]